MDLRRVRPAFYNCEPLSGFLRKHSDFSSVDFLPHHSVKGEDVVEEESSFPSLVIRANNWLRDHPNAHICSCQTVDFKLNPSEEPNLDCSEYRTRGEDPNDFLRGLRIWVWLQKDPLDIIHMPVDQINYFNVLPAFQSRNLYADFERQAEYLHETLAKINILLRSRPVAGKILTLETLNIRCDDHDQINPDSSRWTERDYAKEMFVTVMRVFYVQGHSTSEQISIADFVPSVLQVQGTEANVQRPLVESFPVVLAKCREWLSLLPQNYRLLSVQTLQFSQQGMQPINTMRTMFCENNMHSYQVKFLRVSLAVTEMMGDNPSRMLPLPVNLQCRIFVPELIAPPGCFSSHEFENQQATRQRLQEWVSLYGVKIISVETLAMRVFCGAENFEGFNTMHTWNRVIHHTKAAHSHQHNFLHGRTHHRHGVRSRESMASSNTFLVVYRVYYDGGTADSTSKNQIDCGNIMSGVEQYMLSKTPSSCVLF